jgi:two-component system, chemotaxis family, chemotaxis protein CheY
MADSQKKRVLLIDDDDHIRQMLSTLLEFSDYDVVGEAENGKKGLEKFLELKPDAVLLDINMPVMDGVQTLKAILEADPDCTVIMLTAESPNELYEECLALGAKRFIQKGLPMEEIHQKIEESLP